MKVIGRGIKQRVSGWQARDIVWFQVLSQMEESIWDVIRVRNGIRDQIGNQVKDQVWKRVWIVVGEGFKK